MKIIINYSINGELRFLTDLTSAVTRHKSLFFPSFLSWCFNKTLVAAAAHFIHIYVNKFYCGRAKHLFRFSGWKTIKLITHFYKGIVLIKSGGNSLCKHHYHFEMMTVVELKGMFLGVWNCRIEDNLRNFNVLEHSKREVLELFWVLKLNGFKLFKALGSRT